MLPLRRKLLLKFPFPETVLLSEDAAVCYEFLKAGHRVVYEPTAHVIHGHERRISEEFGWVRDCGNSLKRCIQGNPEFATETKYGLQKVAVEVWFFTRKGKLGTATLGFSIYMARWLGVQLGKRETRLPEWFLRRDSPTLKRERSLKEAAVRETSTNKENTSAVEQQ